MRGLFLALAIVIALVHGPAATQDFPSRTITMIVPFPPGGGNDTMARIVASKLSAALGQQVVVDNRPGTNGVIAMRTAARAAPDGTTIVFANTSSTTINVALNPNAGYDTHKDFAPASTRPTCAPALPPTAAIRCPRHRRNIAPTSSARTLAGAR